MWSLPSHRAAFRAIASGSSGSSSGSGDQEIQQTVAAAVAVAGASSSSTATTITLFIRFANGLLNETNALVTSMLEKLMDIKDVQGAIYI